MKHHSTSTHNRLWRHGHGGPLVVGVLVLFALSANVTADIVSAGTSKAGDTKSIGKTRLVSASDIANTDRFFRCWQNGRLIIDESGLEYVPSKGKQLALSFGSNGQIVKRLFIDGETTCLVSDTSGLKTR